MVFVPHLAVCCSSPTLLKVETVYYGRKSDRHFTQVADKQFTVQLERYSFATSSSLYSPNDLRIRIGNIVGYSEPVR